MVNDLLLAESWRLCSPIRLSIPTATKLYMTCPYSVTPCSAQDLAPRRLPLIVLK
jgi:hypothetical protein